ncbi:HAMP domain-containing protein [candidate division WOR-3 bacterium]|nr:HAMP domain-containing protein [candidate division WOR-3 bacterium]
MRHVGIMWRQFFYYFLIIVVTVSVLAFFTSREINRFHINQIETNLKHQAELVEEILYNLSFEEHSDRINEVVNKVGKKIGTRITVVRIDGVVIGDSEEDPINMENHATRSEIAKALRGKYGKSIRFSTTVKKDLLYTAIPIKRDNKIIGVIRTSYPLREVEELISTVNRRIFCWAISLIVFGAFLSLISSKAFAKPIREMVQSTKKIANGDFTTRVSTRRKDELGELAHSLNWMTKEIQRLFSEVTTEKEELATILSSMTEGVVVLDSDGKIIITNDGFKKICGLPTSEVIIGRHYWEILRSTNFKQLIDELQNKGKTEPSEIHIGDKTYLGNATLTYKGEKKEVVAVLYDITEIKRLAKMKSEFVASASHELRTPLTAIKGFIETLEEDSKGEEQQHFLRIIKRHTERMINLVSDLLLLSKLEVKERKLEIEDIDLKELLYDIINIFKDKLEKKGLKAELITPDEFPVIKGDPFFIEQAFINLLDNAIKYTQQGGIKIELFNLDKQIKIEVSDTGIGIPKEHIPRIFERFYTIDKARSRKLGGTGLGLSIVKHITLAHNGKIDVESEPGEGSKFIITFPKHKSS